MSEPHELRDSPLWKVAASFGAVALVAAVVSLAWSPQLWWTVGAAILFGVQTTCRVHRINQIGEPRR